mmetsp:Transcript_15370/g.43604  ORF Transcript_15370/g.43604 Transcript_15370/m.43604 type:complete len:201 (-) Transcript_15370:905-1507(-)
MHTIPRASAVRHSVSASVSSVLSRPSSISLTAEWQVPQYAMPSPRAAQDWTDRSVESVRWPSSRAMAGSHSLRTPLLMMPTASSAPASTWLSFEYRYLSTCGRPPSMSHIITRPREAVALILPCSLLRKIQLLASWESSSPETRCLSLQKPALSSPFTTVAASMFRAESSLAAVDPDRGALKTSSGSRPSTTSRSCARAR